MGQKRILFLLAVGFSVNNGVCCAKVDQYAPYDYIPVPQFGRFVNFHRQLDEKQNAVPPDEIKTSILGCMRQLGRMDNAPLNSTMRSSLNGQIFQTGFIDSHMVVAAASQQGAGHPNEDFFGVFHGKDLGQQSFTLMILADGHGAPEHDFRIPDQSGGYAKWNLPAPGGAVSEVVVREAEKFFISWLSKKKYTTNDIGSFIPSLSSAVVKALYLMHIKYEHILKNSGSTVSITLLSAIGDIITVHSGNLGDSPGMMSNHFPSSKKNPVFRSTMVEHNISVKREVELLGKRLEAQGYVSIPGKYRTYMRSRSDTFQVRVPYVWRSDGSGLQVTGSFGDFAHYEAKRNWINVKDVRKYRLAPCKSCVTAVMLASDGISDKFDKMNRELGWQKQITAKLDETIRGIVADHEEAPLQKLHQLVEDAVRNNFRLTSDDTTMVVLLVWGYGYTTQKKVCHP